MLSDEEKKAIDWFREDLAEEKENCGKYNDYKKQVIRRNERLLNLIEKQSKEIEELKKYEEGYKLLSYSLDNYTSNDKIKAKIEELEKGNKNTFIRGEKILVLQSLLEKE